MSALRTALRIAGRDARLHRWRTLLTIALIALPVAGLVTADVLYRSTKLTQAETIDRRLAGADASIEAVLGVSTLRQSPDQTYVETHQDQSVVERYCAAVISSVPPMYCAGEGVTAEAVPIRPLPEVRGLLPAGSTITRHSTNPALPVSRSDGSFTFARADGLDLSHPAAAGRYRTIEGRIPADAAEVVLSPELAGRLDIAVGSRISVGSPATPRTVVGLVEPITPQSGTEVLVGFPETVETGTLRPSYLTSYLVTSPEPLDWAAVQLLNSEGLAVFSRAAITDPTAHAADALVDSPNVPVLAAAAAVLVIMLGLLQVIFLAGPAFAVSARRMRRQLGQLTAIGADGRQIRAVVLASGLGLGTIGAATGAALGIGVAWATRPLFNSRFGYDITGLHIRVADIVVLMAVGVLTSVLAALPPAVAAARADPISTLRREPSADRHTARWAVVGGVCCGFGVVVTLLAADPEFDTLRGQNLLLDRSVWLGAGIVLGQVGLLMATPLILAGASKLGSSLPVSMRLALRDADRHRGRTVPAVAAVMAVTSAAIAASIVFATMDADQQAGYRPNLPTGQILARTVDERGPLPALDPEVVPARWAATGVASFGRLSGDNDWVLQDLEEPPQGPMSGNEDIGLPAIMVGDATLRQMITGVDDPTADAVLNGGGTVVFDHRYLSHRGNIVLGRYAPQQDDGIDPADRHVAPAAPARPSDTAPLAILSPQAARSLGVDVTFTGLLVQPGVLVPDDEVGDLAAAFAAAGLGSAEVFRESGRHPVSGGDTRWIILLTAALLVTGAVVLVTALGVVDAGAELSVLAAVGATGRTRRLISGWSSAGVAVIGGVLGCLLGLVAAFGILQLSRTHAAPEHASFVFPWGMSAPLLVGLPVAAFLLGVVFSRPGNPPAPRI
ncbi:hypothetical protein D1871_18775 [Nakamurella silvestris]|nr:hypothetical protein D1871_18775 [Nakamurella silvestris]